MRLDFWGWTKIRCLLKQERGDKWTRPSRFTHHRIHRTKRENFPTVLLVYITQRSNAVSRSRFHFTQSNFRSFSLSNDFNST